MQKPAQIRAIYAELRSCLGPEVPSGDLLRIANLILGSYVDVSAPLDEFGEPRESQNIHTLAVDVAIEAGCRVFNYEHERAWNVDELEQPGLDVLYDMLDRYLGSEWRQHFFLRSPEALYRPTADAGKTNRRIDRQRGEEIDQDVSEIEHLLDGAKKNSLTSK